MGLITVVKGGIVEVRVGNARYLSPSQFAIWIPQGIGHTSYMRRSVSYCSVTISRERAELFPERPCLIEVSDLTSAIAETIKHNGITIPETEQDIRLAEVMFDQLLTAKQYSRFIPSTTDTLIQPIIDAFEKDPADAMTLTEWANKLHTTERTVARQCLSELGMSFTEWRSRVRFVQALTLLKQGKQVKEVALPLGSTRVHRLSPCLKSMQTVPQSNISNKAHCRDNDVGTYKKRQQNAVFNA
ncbi:AraC family transcriptional regulator [Veronia nyctiphanis]|uniref:AraC family transcriptional regulator n=1 Tax=Veronia nyctiphanis TaxID=1278244 RepID=A0A4Q0YM47_9GAMM|nr:helix-turn-helix domain-containing protein [Veronia nyctiphanis]RXJ71880.1 AraC family transcriptional regulator [Veronia nyctiphanis]